MLTIKKKIRINILFSEKNCLTIDELTSIFNTIIN